MKNKFTRRSFLQTSALAGVGVYLGTSARARGRSTLDEIGFASIGVGGKGDSDCSHAGALGNMVAICDIDDNHLAAKAAQFPKAKKYNDFRKMLEEMGQQIDAVTVSTPDHTHAVASAMAMRMGKHVYCQKPLTHTVHEARVLRQLAKEYKVATQMGNQGTAEDGLRRAIEIVQAGDLGDVTEVHVWTNRPTGFWKQAPDMTARPTDTPSVPPHVHWDLFLGPASERPYHGIYHPFHWRGWWDFGTGALGDMACHTANMAFHALKLGLPTAVSAENSEINPETYPEYATIKYEFPARGNMKPVTLFWYEGFKNGKRNLPNTEIVGGAALSDSGSFLVGTKGVLFSPNDYGAAYTLLPEKNFLDYKGPPESVPRTSEFPGGHDERQKQEWVRMIREGVPAMANFDFASVMTEAMLLGNVAMRAGTRIEYDGENMSCPNCEPANQYLKSDYRDGWVL